MAYQETINGKIFYFYNTPRISVSQFFQEINRLSEYNLSEINYETVIQYIQKICNDYTYLLSLQEYTTLYPGDIIYYSPGEMYRLGHMETVMGVSNSSTFLNVYKSHPYMYNTEPYKSGYAEQRMKVSKNDFSNKIFSLHYIGPNAPLIRATASFITKLFIHYEKVDYGGFCSIVFHRCSEYSNSENSKRIERLQRALRKLVSSKRTTAVCSGFSILMFQLAFIIHGMLNELNAAMPLSAKHCSPWSTFNILSKNPNWETVRCNTILNESQYIIFDDFTSLLQSSDVPLRPNISHTVLPTVLDTMAASLRPTVLAKPKTLSTLKKPSTQRPTLRSTLKKPSTLRSTLRSTLKKPSTQRSTLQKPSSLRTQKNRIKTLKKTLRSLKKTLASTLRKTRG